MSLPRLERISRSRLVSTSHVLLSHLDRNAPLPLFPSSLLADSDCTLTPG